MEQPDIQNQIGETAGMIYQAFVGKGIFDLAKAKEAVKADENLIILAVGWLSRENKISAGKDGKKLIFEIRP